MPIKVFVLRGLQQNQRRPELVSGSYFLAASGQSKMLKQVQHDVCLELQHTRHSNAGEASLHQRNRSLNGCAYSQIAGI